jgi:hypothetical protein
MTLRFAIFACMVGVVSEGGSVNALTNSECTRYEEALGGGIVTTVRWPDFRKAHCDADGRVITPVSASSRAAPVFPADVSAKYAGEPRGKARMHTCLDQFLANRRTDGNGGLKWMRRGGGYYFLCDRHLRDPKD